MAPGLGVCDPGFQEFDVVNSRFCVRDELGIGFISRGQRFGFRVLYLTTVSAFRVVPAALNSLKAQPVVGSVNTFTSHPE